MPTLDDSRTKSGIAIYRATNKAQITTNKSQIRQVGDICQTMLIMDKSQTILQSRQSNNLFLPLSTSTRLIPIPPPKKLSTSLPARSCTKYDTIVPDENRKQSWLVVPALHSPSDEGAGGVADRTREAHERLASLCREGAPRRRQHHPRLRRPLREGPPTRLLPRPPRREW